MKKLTLLLFIIHFSLFTIPLKSEAQIIQVPADYPTIQEGIDASSDGDTVLVAEDTYYENIIFYGKAILLASEFILDGDTSHINNTIINGSQPDDPNYGSVVYFVSGEDTTSVLCGFTITGGTGTWIADFFRGGGGVCFLVSGGKLLYNHIEYNQLNDNARTNGGGVWAGAPVDPLPSIVMRHNRINHNKSISYGDEGDGGGFDIWYNLIMEDNELSYNEASGPWRGDGGGGRVIAGFGPVGVFIKNNQVTHNLASSTGDGTDLVLSGGLDFWGDCSGVVSSNNISNNEIIVSSDKTGYGTGLLVELEDVILPDFVFENNVVSNNDFTGGFCVGGGMCIYTSGGKFQNNIIQNNEASYGGGISLQYNTDANQAVFINNTLSGNAATLYGGGFHIISANAVIFNNIIWENTSPEGASIYENNSTVEVRYSDVEGENDWPGEGNINIKPEFMEDGYHIDGSSSPCLDQGQESVIIGETSYYAPEYDFEGDFRPACFGFDIGADETYCVGLQDESSVFSRQSSVIVYPNPTSGPTEFRISNFESQQVSLKIYNVQGQEVATVLDGMWYGGKVARWDATTLPAGIYYYRLTTDDRRLTTASGKIVKY